MLTKIEKRQRRQVMCINRARSARMYAKLLIPVAFITMSTALWSDPVLGPKLAEGLEEVKPILATYAENTPLEGTFGPVPEPVEAVEAVDGEQVGETEEASLELPSTLPTSVKPVNRP